MPGLKTIQLIILKQNIKAHLALLGTNVFFSLNYILIKYLLNQQLVKSFGLNLVRVGVCCILFWILFIFKPVKQAIKRKDYLRFFLCALTGIAVNQLFFIKGLSLTYSIHASLLMLVTPILITVFAAWFLKESFGILKVAGLMLGVAGAVILIMQRSPAGTATNSLLGDVFIIINALSYTAYFILIKPLMLRYEPLVVLRTVFTIGFFIMLPFCWQEFMDIPWAQFTMPAWWALAMLCVAGTFLAYIFNVYGIKILGASIAGTYIYLQPILTAVIAVIALGESLDAIKILAGVLIAAGVFLANKKQQHA